jgi:hypothetical protein
MTMTDDNAATWNTKRTHRFTVILEADDAAKLLSAAARRKMHPNRFASVVMQLVARDDLIDAVLDDDGGARKARRPRARVGDNVTRSPPI